jgi:hypothetical protein
MTLLSLQSGLVQQFPGDKFAHDLEHFFTFKATIFARLQNSFFMPFINLHLSIQLQVQKSSFINSILLIVVT